MGNSEIWKTILLDVPQGILVLLGAIALYDFTKRHHKRRINLSVFFQLGIS